MKKDIGVSDWSAYGKATKWMRHEKSYNKRELIEFIRTLGNTKARATFCAITLLSPRLTSRIGDCRGMISNPWGHLAYNEKLKRRMMDNGKFEKQRFRLRWRKEALPPRYRNKAIVIEAQKTKMESPIKEKVGVTC